MVHCCVSVLSERPLHTMVCVNGDFYLHTSVGRLQMRDEDSVSRRRLNTPLAIGNLSANMRMCFSTIMTQFQLDSSWFGPIQVQYTSSSVFFYIKKDVGASLTDRSVCLTHQTC